MKKCAWILTILLAFNGGVFAHDPGQGCGHESCEKKTTWQDLLQVDTSGFYLLLLQNLQLAAHVINDYESKRLVQSILHDPSALADPEMQDKVWTICERAHLLASLLGIKEEIKDDATFELVESWLKDELLLDDIQVKQQAMKIVLRMQYYNALLNLGKRVSDDETKRLIQVWLTDQSKLDDRMVQERIQAIMNRLDLIKKLKKIKERIKDEKTIKQVHAWFARPMLLDEMDARAQAEKIINRIKLYKKLLALEIKIRDEATKRQVRGWLTDQTRLDDEEVQQRARVVQNRIALMEKLENILKDIRDVASQDKVVLWLSSTPMLDNPLIQQEADTIIERVGLMNNLISIQGKLTDEEEKKLVASWLANSTSLDDPQVVVQAERLISRIIAEQFKKVEKLVRNVKNGSLFTYMLYRKFMFLKSIDTGRAPGWVFWGLNNFMSVAYPITEVTTQLLFSKGDSFDPGMITSVGYVGSLIRGDDACDKIYEMITQKYNADRDLFISNRSTNDAAWARIKAAYSDMLLANDPTSDLGDQLGRTLDGYRAIVAQQGGTEQAWAGIQAPLRQTFLVGGGTEQGWDDIAPYMKRFFVTNGQDGAEWHRAKDVIWEMRKRQVELQIKREGFPKRELDFFSTFDSKYDRALFEKPIDKLLEHAKLPEGVRKVVWKNKLIRFARKMFFFKVVPTWLYWKGKCLWGEYSDEQDRRAFVDYIPFKESVKSIGLSLRLELADFLVKRLNGKIDENGLGFLDRMHDTTLGILGPNLISKMTEFGVKTAMIGVCNEFKPGFLQKSDYFDATKSTQEIIARKASNHVGKGVLSAGLRKIFGLVRPPLFGKISKKTRKFLKFLARRNWIDPMWASESVWQYIRAFPHIATPLVYFFALGENPIISTYEYRRASLESAQTGDSFVLLDYVLAGWIGGELAEWGTDKLINKLKAGQVIS